MAKKTTRKKSQTTRSKRGSSKRKTKKGSFWKKLLILLIIVGLAFLGIKIYEKITGNDINIGIIGGEDGPTVVVTETEKEQVPVDTQSQTEKKEEAKPSLEKVSGNANVDDLDLGHDENSPLFFGNPTDAIEDVGTDTNYLMVKNNYTMSYNNKTLCPNWVGWHLDMDDIGDAPRSNKFVADKALPDSWHSVTKADYQYSDYGFDRGHICPSADRTATQEANDETFLMTNMVPQSPDNNRIVWVALEKYQREIVEKGNEVYIFAGPAGTGGEGEEGFFDYILLKGKGDDGSDLKINVPAYTWKVLLVLPEGDEDLNRVTEDTEVIAVCVPNKKGINSDLSWMKYLCSVDDIEKLTGYDFFEVLEDSIEDVLEQKVMSPSDF